MDEKALNKVQLRLRVAQNAVSSFANCETYEAFREAWYVFLHAAKGIYTTLEQGAKKTPQARQWYGAKDRFRKNDELLRYITEARNDDEHGIEESTQYVDQETRLGVLAPGHSNEVTFGDGNIITGCGTAVLIVGPPPSDMPQLHALDGKPVLNINTPAHARLVNVHDRSGNPYRPPSAHLGAPLIDVSPSAVANLMITYLETLVSEAAGFRKP